MKTRGWKSLTLPNSNSTRVTLAQILRTCLWTVVTSVLPDQRREKASTNGRSPGPEEGEDVHGRRPREEGDVRGRRPDDDDCSDSDEDCVNLTGGAGGTEEIKEEFRKLFSVGWNRQRPLHPCPAGCCGPLPCHNRSKSSERAKYLIGR